MLVLALDTTTRAGSAALSRDGLVLSTLVGDAARPHAERVPADLARLLGFCGLKMADVDVFAVAVGPGSFTGLRIGIAAIQGCAFATGRPVVGVSALDALAHAASSAREAGAPSRIGVWMDAQRQEVFSALFERHQIDTDAALTTIEGPSVGDPSEVARRWQGLAAGAWFPVVGDGAVRYAEVLSLAAGRAVEVIPPPPIAPTIALLAGQRALAGEGTLPHAIRPLYVRRPDAELARDRRRANG